MIDYESVLYKDIGNHYCKHGFLPSAILMSTALLAVLIGYCGPVLCYNTLDGMTHMFHGVEIKTYHSDKLEYYLVTSGCVLD